MLHGGRGGVMSKRVSFYVYYKTPATLQIYVTPRLEFAPLELKLSEGEEETGNSFPRHQR